MLPAINPHHMNGRYFVANSFAPQNGSILLSEYASLVADTDILPNDLAPVLMGLFGEVGGIMSTTKKHVRDTKAYPGYRIAAQEEFGDTLWYLGAICRRLDISLSYLFSEVSSSASFAKVCAASDLAFGGVTHISTPILPPAIDDSLFQLGRAAASLLDANRESQVLPKLHQFVQCYLAALNVSKLGFSDIVRMNIAKTHGAFLEPLASELPVFDDAFELEEQIPSKFEIKITQRKSGRSHLQWNGVFIGDPLTDNIADPDGYRFHDVFHFAHAGILHWSPVFRSLIKQKRKSDPWIDETQDGGRAIIIEEGLTALIFSKAKDLNYFEDHDRVSYGLLKTIQEFTTGYEVAACPLKLWEKAILEGFKVFRQIRSSGGGWVVGDRTTRSIQYRAPTSD
jgi:NTP pyrophosphatase (non-canonical NTP hydrolase)